MFLEAQRLVPRQLRMEPVLITLASRRGVRPQHAELLRRSLRTVRGLQAMATPETATLERWLSAPCPLRHTWSLAQRATLWGLRADIAITW